MLSKQVLKKPGVLPLNSHLGSVAWAGVDWDCGVDTSSVFVSGTRYNWPKMLCLTQFSVGYQVFIDLVEVEFEVEFELLVVLGIGLWAVRF